MHRNKVESSGQKVFYISAATTLKMPVWRSSTDPPRRSRLIVHSHCEKTDNAYTHFNPLPLKEPSFKLYALRLHACAVFQPENLQIFRGTGRGKQRTPKQLAIADHVLLPALPNRCRTGKKPVASMAEGACP